MIRIDLSCPSSQELLWRILHRKDIGGVHLAPPCGTSSRAREIRRPRGPNPKPLRSDRFPDGLPTLKGTDRIRVDKANILYRLLGEIVRYCVLHSISVTVENPARSLFWDTVAFTEPLKSIRSKLSSAYFHHCMYGSQRRKYTQLLYNFEVFESMSIECDGSHTHLPWGFRNKRWSTAEETDYPLGLCKAYAPCYREHLIQMGYHPPASSLLHQNMDINQVVNNQIAVDKQPKGKRIPPLPSEFAPFFTVAGPPGQLPAVGKLTHPWAVPNFIKISGPYEIKVFPKNSRVVRSKYKGNGADRVEEVAIGVHWEPDAFVKIAIKNQRPKNIIQSVPSVLRNTIDAITCSDDVSNARHRTEVARKWMLRAIELKTKEDAIKAEMDQHCAKILSNKKTLIFEELIKECRHSDVNLADNIRRGFSLMGDLPKSNVFPSRHIFATLMAEQVRQTAVHSRRAIIHSTMNQMDDDVCQGVYDATLKEVEQGWLEGPISPSDLGDACSVRRRFGVKQFSTEADGSRVCKIRPIDDFTESLINLTNGSEECIVVHGIDFILAGIAYRKDRMKGGGPNVGDLCAKATC